MLHNAFQFRPGGRNCRMVAGPVRPCRVAWDYSTGTAFVNNNFLFKKSFPAMRQLNFLRLEGN